LHIKGEPLQLCCIHSWPPVLLSSHSVVYKMNHKFLSCFSWCATLSGCLSVPDHNRTVESFAPILSFGSTAMAPYHSHSTPSPCFFLSKRTHSSVATRTGLQTNPRNIAASHVICFGAARSNCLS
jgi:hypothetical protein